MATVTCRLTYCSESSPGHVYTTAHRGGKALDAKLATYLAIFPVLIRGDTAPLARPGLIHTGTSQVLWLQHRKATPSSGKEVYMMC